MKPGQAETNIAALLPFWVNGTLSPQEAALVTTAVTGNPALAEEVAFLRALRDGMQAADTGYSPGEIGLARLKRSLAAPPLTKAQAPQTPLRMVVAAAVVAAIVGFAANEALHPAPVEYVQASGGDDVASLTVAFQNSATAQAISDFLLARGVVILDGPSAIGLYRLSPTEPADLAVLAEQLQARSDLFDMVDLAE